MTELDHATAATGTRSRRAILAAGLAGLAGAMAQTLARPAPAAAANDDYVQIGHAYDGTAVTSVSTTGHPTADAFGAMAAGGIGLAGASDTNYGVLGASGSYTGVRGNSDTEIGVRGVSPVHTGVLGDSSTGTGVLGMSGTGSGVVGFAGVEPFDPTVHPLVGVHAISATGVALAVEGKATFSRSGRVSAGKYKTYVDVVVPGGVSATALCFANLAMYRSGVYVAAVRPAYPSAAKVRIYFNKALPAATVVVWMVLG